MLHGISTSDWHLMGLSRLFPHDHIRRQLVEAEKIFKYAIQAGIQHVFIPGDISETPVLPYDAYIPLVNLIKSYDEHLNIYYVIGNHDVHDAKNTSMDLMNVLYQNGFFKNFKMFLKPDVEKIEGIHCAFLPFPQNKRLDEKKPCLNFAHIEVDGAIGDNGRSMKVAHEFAAGKSDYTISGHIHTYQHLKKKRIIYNGNPYQKNFGEPCPKGFIEFKAKIEDGKVSVKHRFIDNKPNFLLQTVEISKTSDFSKLTDNDNLRYRLMLMDDVVIPDDLLIKKPNIKQIMKKGGKLEDVGEQGVLDISPQELKAIDPKKGLKGFLSKSGLSNKQIDRCKGIVTEALSELGYT